MKFRYFTLIVFFVSIVYNISLSDSDDDGDDYFIYKSPNGKDVACGVERWSVKTCIDVDTVLVNFNNIVPSTITYQRSLPVQTYLPPNNRLPLEDTVYSLDCKLLQYKLEDDGDVHCVIATINNSSETMIGEICDPQCPGISTTSRYTELTTLRNWFVSNYNPTTSWQYPNVSIHIVGVGFYDFLHGQTGIPPNGREIHPILSMSLLTGIKPISDAMPNEFKLFQNYPNPFNPSTNIKYQITSSSQVTLKIYNVLGQEVTFLINEVQNLGTYEITWNAGQNPSGIYFYVLTAGNFHDAKKLMLIK